MQKAIKEYSDKQLVQQLNELYVMERKKMIKQTATGYVTIKGTEKSPYPLVDNILERHVRQEITIGVYSGKYLTKVIGFDVDMKEHSAVATQELVRTLTDVYGLDLENILVSFSGSKGYHVDVFLNKAMALEKAKQFYHLVLQETGYNFTEIELRPTAGQGYKLPLSVHRKTGKVACIVDSLTLVVQPREAIFNVIKADTESLLELLPEQVTGRNELTLDATTAEQFEDTLDGMKMFIPTDYRESMAKILTEGTLLYKDSRNNSTFFLSIFLKEQGYSETETAGITAGIIENTFKYKRDLIDVATTQEFAVKECYRIAKVVFERDYSITEHKAKPIRIYKEDILLTLQPKRKELRQLLFSMICHGKRYAAKDGSFYMAYSVMTKVGNSKDRGQLSKATKKLEEQGLINVIQRNKRKEKSLKSETNVYSINQTNETQDNDSFIELDSFTVSDWTRVTTQLFSKSELRKLVSRRVFDTTFKAYYTAGK